MSDIYLEPFGPAWGPAEGLKGECGWYVHKGRVFVQGVIDVAGKPLTEAEEATLEGGGEVAPAGGTILASIPPAYRPVGGSASVRFLVDPYWTTPGYHKTPVTGSVGSSLSFNPIPMPPGRYGEMRIIFSGWWDTAEAATPGEGANQPFEPTGDFSEIDGTIAIKGSRIWLGGHILCVAEPEAAPKPGEKKAAKVTLRDGKIEHPPEPELEYLNLEHDVLEVEAIPEGTLMNGYKVETIAGKEAGTFRITLYSKEGVKLLESPDFTTCEEAAAWSITNAEWIEIKVTPEEEHRQPWFPYTWEMTGGAEEEEGGDNEIEPPRPEMPLHVGAPVGPHSKMRSTSGYEPRPSQEYPDGIGYTTGVASAQGPAVIKVERRPAFGRQQIETGVFPTDRYTFYDVCNAAPSSKPSLGSYLTPGLGNPKDPGGAIGMSGPLRSKDGMAVFIGDVTAIVPGERSGLVDNTSVYLALPPGTSTPGDGYYRLDFFNMLNATFGPGSEGTAPLTGSPGEKVVVVVDPEWEVSGKISVPEYNGPKVVLQTVNWATAWPEGTEAPSYFQQYDASGYGHKYEFGSGWGWAPLPPGPKSLLIYTSANPTYALRAALEHQALTAPKTKRDPSAVALPGATYIVVEWGEVGKLPFESKAANKGQRIFWDPTPFINDSASPMAPPVFNPAIEAAIQAVLSPFGYTGFTGSFGFPISFLLTQLGQELLKEALKAQLEWELAWNAYAERVRAKIPAGHIRPYGNAAIRSPTDGFARFVPLWVAEYPLPKWNSMRVGEVLDMTNAGYAAKPTPGALAVGPGRHGVVPKADALRT